ncbi:isocitrate lyase/PEP mutase family protein [Sneathiella sp.]|jgi:2-methylisocitrate lyase-like PEP mutase family enzyme|uniref:isocitrate lyase/PEP mutase family protein n=1 Tax=Sneathiella sp. TaxID=1964365 RepID=UPI0039E4CA83
MNVELRRARFSALHFRKNTFVLPNPWDIGSAKMMTALGAEALGTTSAGYAFSQGRPSDLGEIGREQALTHAKQILSATYLPVSADLENGYGHTPEEVATTVERAIEIGLSGCTIEDATGDPEKPLYDRSCAIERIAAASERAKKLDVNFVLTARSENFLNGRPDLDDTVTRLIGYQSVGADVLYAPGLPDLGSITDVCQAVDKPVNVVAGIGLEGISFGQLQKAGVKRISTGSALSRVAYGAMITATNRILQSGSFEDLDQSASFSSIDGLFRKADLFAEHGRGIGSGWAC